LKEHFNFPDDEATFDTLYLAIQEHIEVGFQMNIFLFKFLNF
jgi:hypothetical protein